MEDEASSFMTPRRCRSPGAARIAAGNVASDFDLTQEELLQALELAADVEAPAEAYRSVMKGRIVSLLFEKPSLRTRGHLRDCGQANWGATRFKASARSAAASR